MSLTFDAIVKDLAHDHPRGFVTTFDQPTSQPLQPLNVDLSTVTTSADTVIGVGDPLHEIIHIDFQASANATKHLDILVYNALLHRLYKVPVHSIVILLRPQAAHSNMNGIVSYAARPQRGKMDFGYQLVRLWEIPAEELLTGDLGTLPLAPLGKFPAGVSQEEGLADVVQRLVDRLIREAPPEQTKRLLTAAFLLTGLRVEKEALKNLFRGAKAMQESSGYWAIIDEGREKEAKELILRQGQKKFGPVDEAVKAKLTAITEDIERLERLAERLLDVGSWQELFAEE